MTTAPAGSVSRLGAGSITAIGFVLAFVAWGTVFYGHSLYQAELQASRGWSASLISAAIMSFFLVGIPATMVIGTVIDRYGPHWIAAFGGLAIGSSLFALGRIAEPWQLFFAYLVMGCGYPAMATATISGTLSRWFDRRYGLALSVALSGASAGGVLLPPIMVLAIARYGFDVALESLGLTVIAVILPLALVLKGLSRGEPARREPVRDEEAPSWRRAAVLRQPAFWAITAGSSFALAAQVGFLTHQIPLLSDAMDRQTAAYAVSATVFSALIGRLVVGWASTWMPERLLAALCYLCQGVGFVVLANAESLTGLYVGSVIAGFVIGALVMLPPILLRRAFEIHAYGRIYAMCNVGLYSGAGLGPWLVGVLRDSPGGGASALWMLAALHLLAIAAIFSARARAT